MPATMDRKVTLVTGGAAGIGRAAALLFAKEGARVMVTDLNGDRAGQTVALIRESGGEASFRRTDIGDPAQVQAMMQGVLDTYGRLDHAINNAGIEGSIANLADCSLDNFDRTIRTNLRGTFLCMKYEIPAMIAQGGGAIVNTASVAGLIGFAGIPAYTASKHGIIGLTKNAALEYGKAGIRVNSVCPGGIETRMLDSLAEQLGSDDASELLGPLHPIGRIGQPSEVAELMLWLCSERASFVNGAALPVDGGFTAQ